MIDLEFDGSHVSGVAGCFSYSGDYRADHANGAMQISILSSTQAACDPSMMNLELAYFSALGNFTSYLVSGDPPYADLVLIGGNKSVVFTPKS